MTVCKFRVKYVINQGISSSCHIVSERAWLHRAEPWEKKLVQTPAGPGFFFTSDTEQRPPAMPAGVGT